MSDITLRPRQNGRHFPDDIFKCIFLNENVWISIKIPVKFVHKGPINNIPALFQIMAWRRPGDKPLSEKMMVTLLTHICVTRPQWVEKQKETPKTRFQIILLHLPSKWVIVKWYSPQIHVKACTRAYMDPLKCFPHRCSLLIMQINIANYSHHTTSFPLAWGQIYMGVIIVITYCFMANAYKSPISICKFCFSIPKLI